MAASVSGNGEEANRNGRSTPGGADPRPEAGGPPPAAGGMGSSVTPHAGITGDEGEGWKLLACGVDTLDLAGYVTWGEDWLGLRNELEKARDNAQAADRPVFLRDTCCGPCVVGPTGKPPMFRYHLRVRDFHVFLGRSETADKAPNAYISPVSRGIWTRGAQNTVTLAEEFLKSLGAMSVLFKASRVDLCADFLIPGGLPLGLLRDLGVPEDVQTCDIMQGAKLETFYIGSAQSSIRARVYDKAKEVAVHGKEWFREIWGVDRLEDVWRVEFQLRRAALRAYGVDTPDGLWPVLGGIWADLAGNWFSLRLRDDANTTRRSVHAWWLAVQACAEKFGSVSEVKRRLTPGNPAGAEFYLKRGKGIVVGFGACLGIPDLDEVLQDFCHSVRELCTPEEYLEAFRAKVVELGGPLEGEQEEGGDSEIPF